MKIIKWKPTPFSMLVVTGIFLLVVFFEQRNLFIPKLLQIRSFKNPVHCPSSFNSESIHYQFHKEIWQNLTSPSKQKIYLYGAYYDDRPMHKGKKIIQILAVGAFPKEQLYAAIWTTDSEWNSEMTTCSKTKQGTGHLIEKLYYDQFFLSCEMKNRTHIPKYVSLTYDKCSMQSNRLSVHIPERKRKHKFSVCVETSYGHIDPYQIIEWVEANMLMGVTMFNVYPCNVSTSNLALLRKLESDGIMRVTTTPSPLPETTWANQMLSSPASFNDCMMRQIYSAEYIIPLDFDEIISPRKNAKDYAGLIEEVDAIHQRKGHYPVYSFRMGLFFTTCGTNATSNLNSIRFTKRTNFYGNVKSIVNPRLCLSVFNHYCRVYFKSSKEPKRVNVEPEIALVNHYRKSWSTRYCRLLHKDGIDDVIFRDKYTGRILAKHNKRVDRYRKLKIL